MKPKHIAMLGSGFIGDFYTASLHRPRSQDRVKMIYSRNEANAKRFAKKWSVPFWTTNLDEAVAHPGIDTVVIALSNDMHLEAARKASKAGKAVLCTKPLGRNATEAMAMLEAVEQAGVFHGYLEDLVYTHKTLKARESVENGAIGRVFWVRSRETHPGPHSDWFWTPEISGGGVIVDMGCHCIEIARNFIGKDIRPVEVVCWADTQVHPIEAEDHGIGLVKYENGAIGQFEVSWSFRGGMDLRDEISGLEGTIWLNHFLRTGFEMFSAAGEGAYIAEKAETEKGWLFPVGDEIGELGYDNMFEDMFAAMDGAKKPMEDFYDGYVVNAVIDACYRSALSKKWEDVGLALWRGSEGAEKVVGFREYDSEYYLIKEEKLPDRRKLILKNKKTGRIIQKEV
jgi:predicted dehydrogenase